MQTVRPCSRIIATAGNRIRRCTFTRVLSALIGIALDEKLIKELDSPLGELLPRHRAQMTGDMARVTLRQLMTMSAGFQDDDSTPSLFGDVIRQDGDAVTFILKRGLVSTPGETFAYSNSSAHLVSAVLTQALRQADGSNPRTVLDYATEKLFKPLGIDTRNAYTARFRPDDPTPFENAGFGWATDAQAINIGAGGLRLRPADMLKFGQLYLDHGKWHGEQLVPEEWVAASVAKPRLQPVRVDVVARNDPQRRFGVRGEGIRRPADRCRSRAPTSRHGRLSTHQGLLH